MHEYADETKIKIPLASIGDELFYTPSTSEMVFK